LAVFDMSDFSTFLFARPSFSEGVGRTMDFGNTLSEYNRSLNGEQADLIAAWMDWGTIGYDLRKAIEEARSGLKQISKA
jgi:hypothetical protein